MRQDMTVRDFVQYMANSPDIETDQGELQPQRIVIDLGGELFSAKQLYVRGDNVLIIECE